MRELTQDPFYEVLREYPRCVIDYCLVEGESPHRGLASHREALVYAMCRVIEREISSQRETDARFGWESDDAVPWTCDFEKAEAHRVDPKEFLFVPTIIRRIRGGSVIYDRRDPDVDAGEQIPYWYAFLEPPYSTGHTPEDFRRLNEALFPEGPDSLEVYEWTTDWSGYFDDGHEWWGTACWTIYDTRLDRYAVILASATD